MRGRMGEAATFAGICSQQRPRAHLEQRACAVQYHRTNVFVLHPIEGELAPRELVQGRAESVHIRRVRVAPITDCLGRQPREGAAPGLWVGGIRCLDATPTAIRRALGADREPKVAQLDAPAVHVRGGVVVWWFRWWWRWCWWWCS